MLRLAVFTALALVTATGTATAQTPALASLQGKTTRVGEPPHITAGGQTNWASHNLDPYNQRFAEIDQSPRKTPAVSANGGPSMRRAGSASVRPPPSSSTA